MNRCQRCGGNLLPARDEYEGQILSCINCGHRCNLDRSPLTRLPTDRETNRQAKRNKGGRPVGVGGR